MNKYKIEFPKDIAIRDDGSRMTLEEVFAYIETLPINESETKVEFEQLNCSMEEFLRVNGGVLWNDIKEKYLNRNANKQNTNNQ